MLVINQMQDGVFYRCSHCDRDVEPFGTASKCISITKYNEKGLDFAPYLKEEVLTDPTLPNTDAIPCPNEKCSRPKDAPNRVVYVKYDAIRMLFLYSCRHCDHHWVLDQAYTTGSLKK
jgi:hypothetical protein